MQQGLLRKPTRCLPQQQDQSLVKQVQGTSTYLVQAATHKSFSLDSILGVLPREQLCTDVSACRLISPNR